MKEWRDVSITVLKYNEEISVFRIRLRLDLELFEFKL